MKIGMIGAGSVAQAFARHLLRTGHEVVLSNSRGPESLVTLTEALGTGATAASIHVAAQTDVVLLAVPWLEIGAAVSSLPAWDNRIVIDATNQYSTPPILLDLNGRISSAIVAAQLPNARVVKALNSLLVKNFAADPSVGGGRRVTFVSGDDDDAKRVVGGLLSASGFAVVDLGSLAVGGLMQQAGGPLGGRDLVQFP